MAEEQFTSRRARREAERLAAEQAFEARETPEQPSESSPNNRAELLNPPPAPAEAPESRTKAPEPKPSDSSAEAAEATSRFDAEDRHDPQRAPLPHFESRTARKSYLRDNGLSSEGDVSTGATPVIAGPEETAEDETSPVGSGSAAVTDSDPVDAAGFGGSADEVAARDFEAPVTADSAPRPTALDDDPQDALSQPIEKLDVEEPPAAPVARPASAPKQHDALSAESAPAESVAPVDPVNSATPAAEQAAPRDRGETVDADALNGETNDEPGETSRSRRMPIVKPPSSSGVRVVTAASAQIPAVDDGETSTDARPEAGGPNTNRAGSRADSDESRAPNADSSAAGTRGSGSTADGFGPAQQAQSGEESSASSDDAARALAANPETRPMETVPEAWALPNPDYEDEETENPPGTRIRASEVTGHDGRILVGEEPSKVPYVVLGVAALFAVALIVIALVMLL
ncbi:hypothetical protein [Brevibacterium zhoupengii]|uniref:hypothetical protein n=1 Tax=Brevibacterium zhoupengii TaxID=2898795 RepID=UPI001E5B83D7|nr:hypothetical protein [Brevibacterium zhoupengii]